METTDTNLHIVIFPWLGFGHMLPFLELAKSLAKRGHLISFLSTPNNISRLPTGERLPPSLHLVPLILPTVPGLPPAAEATSDIHPSLIPFLTKAFDSLLPSFTSLISQTSPKPNWIIHDAIHHWLPAAAASAGIPSIFFSIFPASLLAFFGPVNEIDPDTRSRATAEDFAVPPPWLLPNSPHLAFRLHEASWVVNACRPNISGVSLMYRLMKTLRDSKAVALRSCVELEGDLLHLLHRMYRKPVLPVGLLPPLHQIPPSDKEDEVLEWLEGKPPASVLYIAFGSEVELSPEQLRGIALGIELAGTPFVLSMRKQNKELPEGFVRRTLKQGIVAVSWVDQIAVLAHEAVGGFLSHCGASSAIEALEFGKPLVLLPVSADQGLNAREMAERGVGVEVERAADGSFGEKAVARAVRLVMVGEQSVALRFRAKELSKKLFGDEGCQEKYMDHFVEYLRNNRTISDG